MKLEFTGIKEEGKTFRIVNKALLEQGLDSLPKGKYRLLIEKARKNKSNSQLGYLFAGVYPLVLKALNDAGWEFTSVDQVDEYCKAMFSSKEILNRHTGEVMDIPGLKRNMSTVEMLTYVDAIRDWASEYLSVYIPEPEEQIKMEI